MVFPSNTDQLTMIRIKVTTHALRTRVTTFNADLVSAATPLSCRQACHRRRPPPTGCPTPRRPVALSRPLVHAAPPPSLSPLSSVTSLHHPGRTPAAGDLAVDRPAHKPPLNGTPAVAAGTNLKTHRMGAVREDNISSEY